MSRSRLLSAACLALLACARGPEPLRFGLSPSDALRKEFDFEVEMALESLSVSQDGAERALTGDERPNLRLESRDRVVLVDRYSDAGRGSPASVRRSFVELAGAKRQVSVDEYGERVEERGKSSALLGREVRFDWNAAASRFARTFVGEATDGAPASDAGEQALLEGLEEDVDFRAVLPPGVVEPGGRWPVPPGVAAALLHPGGDLHLAAEEDSVEARASQSQLRRGFTGELEGLYWGVRELAGRRFAVLEVRGVVRAQALTREELEFASVEQRYVLEHKLQAEVLWDLEHKCAHAARAESKLRLESFTEQTRKDELTPRVLARKAVFSGTSSVRARFERMPAR